MYNKMRGFGILFLVLSFIEAIGMYAIFGKADKLLAFVTAALCIVFGFVLFTVFTAIGEIAENTEETRKILDEMVTKKDAEDKEKNFDGWICPRCRKKNTKQTGTCGCGYEH